MREINKNWLQNLEGQKNGRSAEFAKVCREMGLFGFGIREIDRETLQQLNWHGLSFCVDNWNVAFLDFCQTDRRYIHVVL